MSDLSQRRCHLHRFREAVARCPSCQRFFCRECITEHEQQVLCARCLRLSTRRTARRRTAYGWIFGLTQFVAGAFVMWMFFYYLGQALISLPTAFHEGSLWQMKW